MVFGLYMYINPFIVPTVTGFGVPFEVMEAQSMHTLNDPFRRLGGDPFTLFVDLCIRRFFMLIDW